VRRLQQAAADRDIREAMEIEDDVTGHFRIEERIRRIKLEEKDMIISEKETTLAEKEAALARERAEKEALLDELVALKAYSQTSRK
jgi:hypothetical protein